MTTLRERVVAALTDAGIEVQLSSDGQWHAGRAIVQYRGTWLFAERVRHTVEVLLTLGVARDKSTHDGQGAEQLVDRALTALRAAPDCFPDLQVVSVDYDADPLQIGGGQRQAAINHRHVARIQVLGP